MQYNIAVKILCLPSDFDSTGIFTPVDNLLCSETGIKIITIAAISSRFGLLSQGNISKQTKHVEYKFRAIKRSSH